MRDMVESLVVLNVWDYPLGMYHMEMASSKKHLLKRGIS